MQLVESIDPELLLGVKGLRSLGSSAEGEACVSKVDSAEEESVGARGGRAAVALLRALQQHNGRRPSSLGLGISADFPLGRLTSSSSSERLEEDAASFGGPGQLWYGVGAVPWGRDSRPRGAERGRENGDLVSSSGAWSTAGDGGGWQREGEGGAQQDWHRDSSRTLGSSLRGRALEAEGSQWRLPLTSARAQQSLENVTSAQACGEELRGDAFQSPLVGLTGEQLTMRRRAKPGDSLGASSAGPWPRAALVSGELEDSAMEPQVDQWEGAGWSSADELSSSRPGWLPGPAPGPGTRRNTSSGSNSGPRGGGQWQGTARGSKGSASFESLEGLKAPQPMAAIAARWGTQVLDDLVCHLRRGSGWLLDKSTVPGGVRAGDAGRSGAPSVSAHPHLHPSPERGSLGEHGDAGIDLPVLSRGTPGASASRPSSSRFSREILLSTSDAGLLGNEAAYSAGAARGTMRRPSKAKTAKTALD